VLAAIVLTLGLEAMREFQAYRMVAYALLLIILMLMRPQGIFGTMELWDLPFLRRRFERGLAKGGGDAGSKGAP